MQLGKYVLGDSIDWFLFSAYKFSFIGSDDFLIWAENC